MRLLIVGILSFIIYLMTCGYKTERMTEEHTFTEYPCEEQQPEQTEKRPLFLFLPDPFNLSRTLPLYFWYDEPGPDTQTFSNV